MSTTILQGFRISVQAFDAFLHANGEDETYGAAPLLHSHPNDPVSRLLHSKISKAAGVEAPNKARFRLVMPTMTSYTAITAYVAYVWLAVTAHQEIIMDQHLPEDVPVGFEELRREVASFGDKPEEEGKMGIFMVRTDDYEGVVPYQPIFQERNKVPQYCDLCDKIFDGRPGFAWQHRQAHRISDHGVKEPINPMPEV